jgi:hypothetical protein
VTPAPFDPERLQAALSLLSDCSDDAQLLQLKNLCTNNGVWCIPENPDDYQPVIYEVTLFGVSAMADDITRLPQNWLRAAQNILNADSDERAA